MTNPAPAETIRELLPAACGPVAQLGARFHGMEEVIGSIPIRSTKSAQQFSEYPEITGFPFQPKFGPKMLGDCFRELDGSQKFLLSRDLRGVDAVYVLAGGSRVHVPECALDQRQVHFIVGEERPQRMA